MGVSFGECHQYCVRHSNDCRLAETTLCYSFHHKGPTLQELADLLVSEASAQWAVNMDGGGSSALAHSGTLVSRPLPWERPVATVLCVQSNTRVQALESVPTEQATT